MEERKSSGADTPRYPHVRVRVDAESSNAFEVLHVVKEALTREVGKDAAAEFMAEATSGDFNHLLDTCSTYVVVT